MEVEAAEVLEGDPFVVDAEGVVPEEGVEYVYLEEGAAEEYAEVPAGEEATEVVYEDAAAMEVVEGDGATEVVYYEDGSAEAVAAEGEAEEVLDIGDEAGMLADAAADALAVEESVAEVAAPAAPVLRRPVAAAAAAAAQPAASAAAKGVKGGAKGKGKDLVKGKASEKGKGKEGKGKGKEGKGKDANENVFYGLVYTSGAKTGNMLIRCFKATEAFGQEVMIPSKLNPAGAKVGDRIAFEIVQGKEGGRPIAVKVVVRGHVDNIQDRGENQKGPEGLRRQVLYYFSDENLKQDAYFQKIIRETGGWIAMSVILGCPRMRTSGATAEAVKEAIQGCGEVEVGVGPDGAEAIRRTSAPPELEGAAAAAAAAPADDGADFPAPTNADVFYVGRVKPKRGPTWKCFVDCQTVSAEFGGKDAWFHPKQAPEGLEPGMSIVFTLAPGQDAGFAPRAAFVAFLAEGGAAPGGFLERRPSFNQKGGKGGKGFKGPKGGAPGKGGQGKGHKGGKPAIAKAGGVQRTIQKPGGK